MKAQAITLLLMFSMTLAGNAIAASQAADNDSRSRIATLEARVAALEGVVAALEADLQAAINAISELGNTKADVNHDHDGLYARINHDHDADYARSDHNHNGVYAPANSNVMDLDPYLTVDTAGGFPRAILTGINLQVVNGQGITASANGVGNIIIGYDEERTTASRSCSLGTDPVTNQPIRTRLIARPLENFGPSTKSRAPITWS